MLGPGQSIEVFADFVPVECGEWFGSISVTGEWKGGHEVVTIPTYARVLQPQTAAPEVATRLPWHAPRPFRPGSAHRIMLDPACSCGSQLRPPLPQRSRSSTRSSTRPTSAVSGYSAFPPPRPGSAVRSRPGSGIRSGTPGGHVPLRSGSLGGDGATAGMRSEPIRDWRITGDGERARNLPARPHSEPSTLLEKAKPGDDWPADISAAAGGGMAAVRARPRSASIRRHQRVSQ